MRVHVCAAWVSQGTPKACTCVCVGGLVCLCVRIYAYVGCVPNRGAKPSHAELPRKDKLAALATQPLRRLGGMSV